jgi:hypothetical protein
MGNPRTLAKLWTFYPSGPPLQPIPSWNPNAEQPNNTIYQVLRENATQSIVTVSIGSLLGSIMLIMTINHIPRKQFLKWSFIWLAVLFAITGGSFFTVFHTNMHSVAIVLVALCHFSFNFGTLPLSPFKSMYSNPLTLHYHRSKYSHIYYSSRDIPHPISLYLPWHCCRQWKARLRHCSSYPALHCI